MAALLTARLPHLHPRLLTIYPRACTTAASTPRVHGSLDGLVGRITIDNRAKKNAMTLGMYEQVPGAVAEATRGGASRVCIVGGAGSEAFGAGSDISEFPRVRTGAAAAAAYSRVENEAAEALRSIRHPLLARIHGPCIGGGLNMALAADLRFASEDATFCVPPARLGIGYPRALMDLLVGAVGKGNATMLLFTAVTVDAQEALRMGLVNAVLPKDELDAYVEQTAKGIARLAPLTLTAAKMELQLEPGSQFGNVRSSGPDPRGDAMKAYMDCYESEDYAEGVRAFREKRRPEFSAA